MSWATNYEKNNNVYTNFPPLMMDGRHLNMIRVDQEVLNEKTMKEFNIVSNNDYKEYLVKNANNIIQANSLTSESKVGNPLYFDRQNRPERIPYHFVGSQDKYQPFGYENSDLKNYYLSREELNHNLVSGSFIAKKKPDN